MNWVDMVIGLLIILSVVLGMWKGFVMSVSNIVCMITSIFAAKAYYPVIANYLLLHTPVKDKIDGYILNNPLSNELSFFKGVLPTAATGTDFKGFWPWHSSMYLLFF